MLVRLLGSLLLSGACLLLLPGRSLAVGFLGVMINMDEEGRGVHVVEIVEDSPASKGGLMVGDLITHLDGGEIGDLKAFVDSVKGKTPGALITLTVMRGDKKEEVRVTVGEA
jgi:S1-C subfamily serine protease